MEEEREGWRERGREGGREGGRVGGREKERERERERESETERQRQRKQREREREREREKQKKHEGTKAHSLSSKTSHRESHVRGENSIAVDSLSQFRHFPLTGRGQVRETKIIALGVHSHPIRLRPLPERMTSSYLLENDVISIVREWCHLNYYLKTTNF